MGLNPKESLIPKEDEEDYEPTEATATDPLVDHSGVISTLGHRARDLREEREAFARAKRRKAHFEDEALRAIVDAVLPALSVIGSKVDGLHGPLKCALKLNEHLYLGEQGDFFEVGSKHSLIVHSIPDVLDRTSIGAVVAVISAAINAQVGSYGARAAQVEREARILEGIAQALKIGGVR